MSAVLTDPDPSIEQLLEEGYELELLHQHLLVHGVPYVNHCGEVCWGVLAAPYTGNRVEGVSAQPKGHTIWLQGETPHHAASHKPMHGLINSSKDRRLFEGFVGNHYLSNKPNNQVPKNFYDLISHYHGLLSAEAQQIAPNVDGRTGRVRANRDPESVFHYPDTASCRSGITNLSQRFRDYQVAIVGVGGTGSYVLDLIAKTPVAEIHLFDGDTFESHNSFRSPGATSIENINRNEFKAMFFQEQYGSFRKGIVSHPYEVAGDTLKELKSFDFVFICIDNGDSRKEICEFLADRRIAFIDTGIGMALQSVEGQQEQLSATCRVTVVSPEKKDHMDRFLDYAPNDDNVYDSNIQIADMNALNAAMAVVRWKQFIGVYQDQQKAHNLTMTMSLQSMHREETVEE